MQSKLQYSTPEGLELEIDEETIFLTDPNGTELQDINYTSNEERKKALHQFLTTNNPFKINLGKIRVPWGIRVGKGDDSRA